MPCGDSPTWATPWPYWLKNPRRQSHTLHRSGIRTALHGPTCDSRCTTRPTKLRHLTISRRRRHHLGCGTHTFTVSLSHRACRHIRHHDTAQCPRRCRSNNTAGDKRTIAHSRQPLKSKATLLDALSPEKVLARGYSLTYGADGHILTEADAVAVGDIITTRLAGGSIIQSQVTSKDNPNG